MKDKLKNTFLKLVKLYVVLTMIIAGLAVYNTTVEAKDDVGRPGVHFAIEYFNGGIRPTDNNGNVQSNTVLISRGKGQGVRVNLVINPDITTGEASNVHFDLRLPYFYTDADGNVVTEYEVSKIPAKDKDENGNPKMGVGAVIIENNDCDHAIGSTFYGESTINASQFTVKSGQPQTVQVELFFFGDVPENTGTTVSLGGGYKFYTDEDGDEHFIDYRLSYGTSTNARFNLICSNLKWESTYQQVQPYNVLWDKYNYLVYKVEISNDSEDNDSYFNAYDLSIKVPTDDDENGYGLLKKEAMKWLYNENGDPIENKSFNNDDRENQFVGVPGEGGVLIYDVTNIPESELKNWDLCGFSNIVDKDNNPYQPLPYTYAINSMITLKVENKEVKKGEKNTYYVAIPIATNVPDNIIDKISVKTYSTIFFGAGSGYSWTKTQPVIGKFDAPKENFQHKKFVIDSKGQEVNKKDVAIGENVDYYLGYFKNTGNIPAFNTYIVDTLPDDFDLEKISILMNNEDGKTPQLADWFSKDQDIQVEFTYIDSTTKQEKTEFISLGKFSKDSSLSDDNVSAWSVNVKSLINSYIKSHKGYTFTGRFQINFKERINPNEKFNGKIAVNGNVNSRAVYVNTLDTNFEKWFYIPPSGTNGEEFENGGYTKTPKTITATQATIETLPAVPVMDVDVYLKNQYDDPLTVPVNTSNAGFRYKLGNDSISNMIPGVFKSGDLLVKTGASNNGNGTRYYGFITEKIIFSKKLIEDISEIQSITLRLNNGTIKTVDASALSQDAEGNYVLNKGAWGNGTLLNFEVNFKTFAAQTALSNDIYIKADGHSNIVETITANGSFETKYNDVTSDSTAKDTGTMNISTINLELEGYSFNDNTHSAINTAKNSVNNSAQATVQSITVANKKENTGYDFTVVNNSVAPVGDANIKIDLSSSVGNKSPLGVAVKGFDTKEIVISGYEGITNITQIKLYEWDQIDTDEPAKTIDFEDLTDNGGSVTITEDMVKDLTRIKYIIIECEDYQGQEDLSNLKKLNIRITGKTDWFDNLDAKLTFTPYNLSMLDRVISLTDRLHVDRPYLSIHANLSYYANTPEKLPANNANSDGNESHLAVPYDRDFKYRVSIENTTISVLDDVDLIVTLPINKNNVSGEENTGFHTTKIVINENLLKQFKELEYIELQDVDHPNEGKRFDYDESTNSFKADDGAELSVVDGQIVIEESELIDWDIPFLGKVIISGDKVILKDATTANAWVDFYGFSDSLFGTTNRLAVDANNYLDGLRDLLPIHTIDHASAYVSKMYFDTTVVAGYVENNSTADRFAGVSTSVEHVRQYLYTTRDNAYFNDNSELDVGYKAIGSFMIDFRQYLNVGTDYPIDVGQPTYDSYIWQEHEGMNYVYTQSMNTAANVNLKVDIPQNSFDTYYLKVDPRARNYFNSITVKRKDGKEYTIEQKDWIDNSVEINAEGKQYFRINLLTEDETKRYETVASGDDNDIYYRDVKDYVTDNPITEITINLDINAKESDDGINANDPDYGRWYVANNQKTKYMFEVTGRFYTEGAATATVTADLAVGGDRGNSATRTGYKAKERTVSGDKTPKTPWSYYNKYRCYWYVPYHWNSADIEYDSGHLKSTTRVYVWQENNDVLKGVHTNPNTNYDDGVKYGEYNEFAVSFYRTIQGAQHDYKMGQGANWRNQDVHDWAGKHAYTDNVVLEDILPTIRPDETTKYCGFLTQKIFISEQLYKYIDHIEVIKKKFDENGKSKVLSDDPITISKDELSTKDSRGFYEILVVYDSDEESSGNIVLGEGEFLNSYKVYLKDIPGNGDFARELENTNQLQKTDGHGTNANVDIFVGGKVYLVKGIHPVSDATNTMKAYSYKQNSLVPYYTKTDDGYMRGYRLPFQAGYDITSIDPANRIIYDYKGSGDRQNLDPNYAAFEVKIWNRSDTSSTDGSGDSAHIKETTITNTMNSQYRLKHIYIPKTFIDGDWFNISSFKLNYSTNKSITLTKEELKNSPYLIEQNNQYVFNVNQFVIDHVDEFETYTATNTGDRYVKEYISSFVMTLKSVNLDSTKPETVLDSGQYLSVDKTGNNPTFTYDGVYVDRTKTDIEKDDWTKNSRPTVLNTSDRYDYIIDGNHYYNYVSATFISSDMNAENYQGNLSGTDGEDYYSVRNLVGTMFVNLSRGSTINGQQSFAYDVDKKDDGNQYLPVDSGHLLPDDYIEYHLTVGTTRDSTIPIYHPDIRFTVPNGQRIVGWRIEKSFTKSQIGDEDITAKASIDGGSVGFDKNKIYSLTEDSKETNYKELMISVGDLKKSVEENQVLQGDKVVIVVVTQLTNELNPFEGKTITATYEAAAHAEHTYSQYRILHEDGQSNGACDSTTAYYSKDGVSYHRFVRNFLAPLYGILNEETYTSYAKCSTTFYDSQNLHIEYTYNNETRHYDRQGMTVEVRGLENGKVANVTNDTLHELESATYTVSFISESNGRYYKGFDLTTKPILHYPASMTPTKPMKIEYCYFADDSLVEEGVYTKADADEIWVDEKDIVFKDKLTEEEVVAGKRLARDAVKIRWTYYDIPSKDSNGNPIVFATTADPFTFVGEGRYRDIRTDKEKTEKQYADRYAMNVTANVDFKHKHLEEVSNTIGDETESVDFKETVNLVGGDKITKNIARERPVMALHTQVFEDEATAALTYDASRAQKTGYRPNDTVWFKTTAKNIALTKETADTGMQGALLDPVVYDKIPEYITADALENDSIHILWYDIHGNLKETPEYTITKRVVKDVPDYGGDIITKKADNDGSSKGTTHAFADITLNSGGNTESTLIDYNLYTIQFAKGTRLEVGERIEIHYSASIREENLPLAYSTRGNKTFVDYYPKMGEYYQRENGYYYGYYTQSYPYIGYLDNSPSAYYGSYEQFNNADVMMDMNYLYHDVGLSGTRNPNIDRYEFLQDATVYMPGESGDGAGTNDNYGGSNSYLKDYDMCVSKNQQVTRYVPTLTPQKLNELPVSEKYVNSANKARDYYSRLLSLRNRSYDWQDVENHEDALIWAQSRLHLQTAWLATSSRFVGDTTKTGDDPDGYLKSAEYIATAWGQKADIHYNYAGGSYSDDDNWRHKLYRDDNITTLEYDQKFISQIGVYNYGDWDLADGIEFIYVMPRGIEPQFDDGGNINVAGYMLSGGTSLSPSFAQINQANIKVEIVQRAGENKGYLSPTVMQDPIINKYLNRTSHDYTKEASKYYSEGDGTPWVLKITVNQSLKKWFNRGNDKGYYMLVNVPAHVYKTNPSEYWYDEVMARPAKPNAQDSLYYQIYDTTSYWGNNLPTSSDFISTQYGGMDYLWDSYYYGTGVGNDSRTYFLNGSPNTPYINGMNISNREVSAQNDLSDSGGRDSFASGKRETYASTGTRAHMRKPLIRTWTTVGKNNLNGTNINDYYVNSEGDSSSLNIHVENKYYLNDLAPNDWYGSYKSPITNEWHYDFGMFYKVYHTYATDGGNKGTLYYPVVTNILPVGVVPKDINGHLFTEDNKENAKKVLQWSISDANGASLNDREKDLYDAIVEYVELESEDDGQAEGRYKITFVPKDTTIENPNKAKIVSGDTRIFSLDFYTKEIPDKTTKDGKTNNDLLYQYQKNHNYVTSQLENFKFLLDSDVTRATTENPYWVGNKLVTSYGYSWYSVGDTRKDAVGSGRIPNNVVNLSIGKYSIIDATDTSGNKRYKESDSMQLEDYPSIRYQLTLNDKDFNRNDDDKTTDAGITTTDNGVYTSNRIRVKHPGVENLSYVSTKAAENMKDLGGRSSEGTTKKQYEYYPNEKTNMQYGDYLYYNTSVSNHGNGSTDYAHTGNILHSKIHITFVLPTIVSYRENDDDRFYIIYKDSNGVEQKITLAQLEQAGYHVIETKRQINDDRTETVTFDIITPGDNTIENPTYQDYVNGYKLPGYFGHDDTFVFGIKTVIDHTGTPDTILSEDKIWDEDYKCDTYVSFHDTEGSYLMDLYPNSDFDKMEQQDMSTVYYVRKETDDLDSDKDIDLDEQEDTYAKDITAKVTVLKPEAVVRTDTSTNRIRISNPDAEVTVAEDPSVKGATKMSIYIDQVINKGSAVPEFIIDYRIPYRGTSEGTREEAPISGNSVYPFVYAIGTGKWVIPESAGSAEYREELKEKLKVHVYALLCDNNPADDSVSYEVPGDESGSWVELTNSAGVSIDENHIIDMTKDYPAIRNKIYQIRYVITADTDRQNTELTRKYCVPQGFRLDIDADDKQDGIQEMDDIDPNRENIENLPDSVTTELTFNTTGSITAQNRVGNAAFVTVTASHTKEEKQHVNHFATVWSRYDDDQFNYTSERARAGYFISREIPTLQVDLTANYFKRQGIPQEDGTTKWIYSWSPECVISGTSSMMKYTATIANLSQETMNSVGLGDEEPDTATKPQVSTVLPYIQGINNVKDNASQNLYNYKFYRYVKYGSEGFDNEAINKDYSSTDAIKTNAATWTWHVEDEEGHVVEESGVENVNLRMYDMAIDLTNLQRRVMTWDFTGQLQPGQKIIIDYMVPLSTEENGIVSSKLLECKAYAFKDGTFNPYIPATDNTNEMYALELDTRDINENGLKKSEITLVKTLGGLSFASNRKFTRLKVSHSEYGSGLTAVGNDSTKPSVVPEGSEYSFTSTLLNPDGVGSESPGYKHPIIYDVLPYEDDVTIKEGLDRGSKWRGYLNLDSIVVEKQFGTSSGVQTEAMVDGKTVNIWIGPFKQENGKIVALSIDDLPNNDKTSNKDFYKLMYGNSAEAIAEKRKYFVTLKELQALKTSNPSQYSEYQRLAQAIYVEPTNEFELAGSTKLTLSYSLKAPLNLPQYQGCTAEDDANLKKNVTEFSSWNTFAAQTEDEEVSESPQAGVYLDAPADKGYIGHYVWLDDSYNAQFTDEGEYLKRDSDGRWLFSKATKDLDYDGIPDDPGINGVKVELLSKNGYPVNRMGEPVVEKDGKWVIVDEDTGKIALNTSGTPTYALYGPEYYITEKDAYGNNGYFIISNIEPGEYKLRYTFPNGTYDEYSLTTKQIGSTGTKTGLDVYRKGEYLPDLGNKGVGDEPSDYKQVDGLVIQTKKAIKVDAIGNDPSTYKAYDEMMTSYDIGVGHSYIYGGYAWLDESPDPNDPSLTTSNGEKDPGEQGLKNVVIQFFEILEDGTRIPTYNGDGELAIVKTDVNGYFETELYPNKSYIAVADTSELTDRIYKPSPFTKTTDPLEYENDNDLEQNAKKENVSFIFKTGAVFDPNTGKPIMTNGSHGKFIKLGFGFVEAGKGFIGKYIFDDKNYDGIRNQYKNQDGDVSTEPGVDGVKLILEQYYYDTHENKWKSVKEDDPTQKDRTLESLGGSYTFQNVRTTYRATDGQLYLAGYKVKLDTESIPDGYTPTKYYMNKGILDSDLEVDSQDRYRYLSDMLIIAEEVTGHAQGNPNNIYEVNGKQYDATETLMILDIDAGLTTVENAIIEGIVWDDKNYDGQQNQYKDADQNIDEPGISGIGLQLVPYYYDSAQDKWEKLDTAQYSGYNLTAVTDDNGHYQFNGVRSYITIGNKKYLVSYKIKVTSDLAASDYAVTRYHIGDTSTDSDLTYKTMLLNESKDYIIVAKKIADTNDKTTIEKNYGKEALGNQTMLIHNKLGYFDINKVVNIKDYDAGLLKFEKNSISGRVWDDANYNGIIDDSELGIENVQVQIMQYYFDSSNNTWIKNDNFAITNVSTNTDGNYEFTNLDTYVYVNNQYYLAGYKAVLASQPDRSIYAITLYRQETDGRNSDLQKDLLLNSKNEYIIISDEAQDPNNTPYIVDYQKKKYDLVTSASQGEFDAGYIKYPNSKIIGQVFDDLEYDGKLDGEDGFVDELKDAITNTDPDNKIIITALAYYYDDGWKPYQPQGSQQYFVKEVTSEDGTYELEVPTQFTVDGKNYLAGYELKVNLVPKDYHITKYLVNNGQKDSTLIERDSGYRLTKSTSKGDYKGNSNEELESLIVAANVADKKTADDNVNIQKGYDLVLGRTLEDYNAGYTKVQKSSIEGIAFEDVDYNGIYDKNAEDSAIENVEVGIKRYYYENGQWILDNSDDPNITDMPEYYMTTITDREGVYRFENLPTYKEVDDGLNKLRLYGYTVWYIGGVNNLAVTKYQTNDGIDDSALDVNNKQIVKNNKKLSEMKDGYTIIANKVTDIKDASLSYIVEGYDVAEGRDRVHYNLGFTNYQDGSIEGNAFIETDYNGILDEGDQNLEGIELGLKRYSYDSETKKWSLDQGDVEYIATIKTDENGYYCFNNLGTYKEVNGVKYLYGYEVWLINGVDDTPVTKYQANNGVKDNALVVDTHQVIKKDKKLSEMKDGYIIVANQPEDTSDIDDFYMIDGYDVISAKCRKDYNVGYTPYQLGSIEGIAFDDLDYDGIYTEKDTLLQNVEIGLKRYYYNPKDKKWHEAGVVAIDSEADNQYLDITTTDENGHYIFNDLPAFEKTSNEPGNQISDVEGYLYGYELWLITEDQERLVTKYQMNEGIDDSSLLADTHQIVKKDKKLPEVKDGYIILGENTQDQDEPNKHYVMNGFDIVKGNHRQQYNLGFVPVQTQHISGSIWEDLNEDGIANDNTSFEGIEVTLERLYMLDGKWYTIKDEEPITTMTDNQGHYVFNDLEVYGVIDGKIVLYGYKVKVEKLPNGYDVTDYQTNKHQDDSDLNVETGYLEEDEALIVLADKADQTTDAVYNVGGYNLSHGHSQEHLDGGLVPYGQGSIQGVVFEDENRNGILDDNEKVINDAIVYLDYLTEENDGIITNIENMVYEKDQFESFKNLSARTDENGVFTFDNLPILDENNQPYQYRLRMYKPEDAQFTKVYQLSEDTGYKVNIYGGRYTKAGLVNQNEGITNTLKLTVKKSKDNYYGLQWETKGRECDNLYLGYSYDQGIKTGIITGDTSLPEFQWILLLVSGSYVAYRSTKNYRRKRKETD